MTRFSKSNSFHNISDTPDHSLISRGVNPYSANFISMLSPKTKRNVARIIPFGLIWLFAGIIYSLLERGLLGNLPYYPSTGNPYNFVSTLVVTAITASLLGLFFGALEISYFSDLFARRSFTIKIVFKTLIYLCINIFFLLLNSLIYNSATLNKSILDAEVWENVMLFFSSFSFWSVEVYIAAVIGVSLFYTEVSQNLGQGVLNNFFVGKYHKPKVEERIFMFLDMKSSTTIAEKIGHVRYFEMLKEYFADLSDSIIRHSGEIYQYVGDEVVLSWKLKNGLVNNNCIRCFFAMKDEIKKQIEHYNSEFGLLPEFKAGLHIGKVTTGEIGVIKKEIIFTGDVLNTTARIQGLCNSYEVDILVSDPLLKKLNLHSQFQAQSLGEKELRGRGEKIMLYTIMPIRN
jgi:adenylate cyclase